MKNKKKLFLVVGIAVLIVCIGAVWAALAFFGGSTTEPEQPATGEVITYTVEVKSASGLPLADIGLYIYEDDTLKELASFIKTDETGAASFEAVERDTYVAVIDKVPTGYEAEPYYKLTGALTEIVLATGQMTEADIETLTYELGDAVLDFSVTGPTGKVYTLSELFEGKKAVVLNFFYNECQPCMLEFPYLQEAYEEYKDDIAVLAMNPVNTDEGALLELIQELGVTFPMVLCGPEWESIMQLTAYPTTVIIDRFGNICLIHKGAVPDAKTFKDAFAYFTADDYEQKLIKSIEDLKVEEPEGTEENPTEVGGVASFEVTVEPGQVVYHDLYKVTNMYLQIRSENAYVIYNGKTYYPKNGVVGLIVSAPDTFTPAKIGIGNSGTKTETFKVTLSVLAGTFNNPYKMSLGEFDVSVAAGNDQGVYYSYTATEDGTLTLQCLSATAGVKYGYYLYNLSTSAMRNLESDSEVDASGAKTVSIQAKKGQTIQVCISTLPDDSNSYPAANFRFKATFSAGKVEETEVEQKTDYTVTVCDDAGVGIANISVVITVGEEEQGFTTDQNGVAAISLATGTYTGKIYVPEGYTADVTQFQLTEAAPSVTLTLKKIKQFNYTVKVKGGAGEAIADVLVKIGESDWLRTDTNGVATLLLNEGTYAVTIMIPTGYTGETTYNFAAGATELTITLGYPEGSEKNPYKVEQYPYDTPMVAKSKEVFCRFYFTDEVALTIRDADAYFRLGQTTYTADDSGVVTIPLDQPGVTSPVVVAVGNGGTTREKYTVEAVFAEGSEKNPYQVDTYPYVTPELANQQEIWCTFTYKVALSLQINDADAYVRLGETTYTADEQGIVTVPLDADGVGSPVTVVIGSNAAENKAFTVELNVPPLGSEKNPHEVEAYPYTTPELESQQEFYFTMQLVGAKMLQIEDADAYIRMNNVTYAADINGVVSVPVEDLGSSVTLVIGNSGTENKAFAVNLLQYALGSEKYPEAVSTPGELPQLTLEEGNADGYYYTYTPAEAGTFEISVKNDPGVQYDIKLSTATKNALLSQSGTAGKVSLDAEAEETVTIWVYTLVDSQTGTAPGATFELSTAFTPEPEEEPSVPGDVEYTYTVTVTDVFGAAMPNIGVIFMKDGDPVEMVNTDADGVAEMYTYVLGQYTVELFFEGESYYYDKTAAVLPANNRNLTIKLVGNLDENDKTEIYILNGNSAYNLYVGGTHIQVSSGKPNFSAEYGSNCFFTFTPTEAGTYQITADDSDTELSFWGATTFINQQYSSKDSGKNNAITESISGTSVGNITYVIGVKAGTDVTDVVLNIARIGEPEFNIADQPWTEWKSGYTHSDSCKISVTGTPTYFNLKANSGTYNLYYDEANGYYRLYQGGPVVMVNLGANTNTNGTFVGLYERINGNGQYGGSSVTRYFYDSTGAFVKKEDYTECFADCFSCAGITAYSQTAYHPLTKDLMYALQNGFADWWDSTSGNYLPVFANANKEYAWMFACCYVA